MKLSKIIIYVIITLLVAGVIFGVAVKKSSNKNSSGLRETGSSEEGLNASEISSIEQDLSSLDNLEQDLGISDSDLDLSFG